MPESGTYPNCLVCGDKSSGLHYGIYSCEGCKCFFRRSANGSNVKPCKAEGLCEINVSTRGKCQGCRYSKCVSVGMMPDESPIKRRSLAPKASVKKKSSGEGVADKPVEPFPCEVCADNAFATAYGINCCSGCKSFFRRSLENGGDYKCREDEFCDITLKSRQRCKKCRYIRCLEAGMKSDVLRKYNVQEAHETGSQPEFEDEDLAEFDDIKDSPEPPKPAIGTSCVICGDQAFGRHHGVICCMGCKCFFARSIVKNRTYVCVNEPDACSLLKTTKCKLCRLQKCLDVGMVRATRRFKKTSKSGMRLRPQGDDSDLSDLGFDSDEEELDLFTYLKLTKTDTDPDKDPEEASSEKREKRDYKQNGVFSPENNQPITDKLCEVCGDKAAGRSYNVMSCSSCASFFRVTSKTEEEIECVCDEITDDLSMEIRRKCPYCRYQKCLAAGMKRITLSKRMSRSPKKAMPDIDSEQADTKKDITTPKKFKVKMFNFSKTKKLSSKGRRPASDDEGESSPLKQKANRSTMPDGCVICGDEADGLHYGVYSCMGCNCFFKRTMQKNLKYVCAQRESACSLQDRGRAGKCQQCRIEKCLAVGMKHIGRLGASKARKAREAAEAAAATVDNSQTEMSVEASLADTSQSECTSTETSEHRQSCDAADKVETMTTDAEVAAAMTMPAGPLCAVCGDEASGMRGGVHCCVDCRSFLYLLNRDSIAFLSDCPKEPKCDLNSDVKKACTYCRYQKCIDVGMDKGVSPSKDKPDLIKKVSKRPSERQASVEEPDTKKSKSSPSTEPCSPEKRTNIEEPSDRIASDAGSDGGLSDSSSPDSRVSSSPVKDSAFRPAVHTTSPCDQWTGIKCVVCGDKAFSRAFSVYCCKSCKTFFRKSLTIYQTYQCRGFIKINKVKQEGKCPTPSKKCCSFCRFQHCRLKGMKSIELGDNVDRPVLTPKKLPQLHPVTVDANSSSLTDIANLPIMVPSGKGEELPENSSQDSGFSMETKETLQWNSEPTDQLDMLRRAMENLKDATTASDQVKDSPEDSDTDMFTSPYPSDGYSQSKHEALLENIFTSEANKDVDSLTTEDSE